MALAQWEPKQAELYVARGELVNKKFLSGLSPKEERRLGLLTWQLRILRDAKERATMDSLAQRSRDLVAFAASVAELKTQVLDYLPKRRKG